MNFILPRRFPLFLTIFALGTSISHVVAVEENDRRTLLRSSDAASSSARRLDDMMPPEGYSIRCIDNPHQIFRWGEGQIRYYPDGKVAMSWDRDWRKAEYVDCTGLPIGPPMSLNDHDSPIVRGMDLDEGICGLVQSLPPPPESSPEEKCEAALWADDYFKTNHPVIKARLSSKLQAQNLNLGFDPAVCIAACATTLATCATLCILTIIGIAPCEAACGVAETVCIAACAPI